MRQISSLHNIASIQKEQGRLLELANLDVVDESACPLTRDLNVGAANDHDRLGRVGAANLHGPELCQRVSKLGARFEYFPVTKPSPLHDHHHIVGCESDRRGPAERLHL